MMGSPLWALELCSLARNCTSVSDNEGELLCYFSCDARSGPADQPALAWPVLFLSFAQLSADGIRWRRKQCLGQIMNASDAKCRSS